MFFLPIQPPLTPPYQSEERVSGGQGMLGDKYLVAMIDVL